MRAPVLAVFTTTVLAQLSSVFLIKEAVERLLEVGHHHGGNAATNHYFYASAIANVLSLMAATYAVSNQPFNYVLMSAQSSVIQVYFYFILFNYFILVMFLKEYYLCNILVI